MRSKLKHANRSTVSVSAAHHEQPAVHCDIFRKGGESNDVASVPRTGCDLVELVVFHMLRAAGIIQDRVLGKHGFPLPGIKTALTVLLHAWVNTSCMAPCCLSEAISSAINELFLLLAIAA